MLVVEVAFAVAGECDKNATKTETVVEHSQQRFQRVIKDNYSSLIVYVDTDDWGNHSFGLEGCGDWDSVIAWAEKPKYDSEGK
jgi:hypothetical protein